MSDSQRDERHDEKGDRDEKDEKELGKRDEKHEEKSYEEKYRRDPLGSLMWAIILIWAGVVLLADNLGMLENLKIRTSDLPFYIPFFGSSAWSLFFVGAGVIVLIEIVIRLLVPTYRQHILGTLIWAIVLLGIGIGNWAIVGPLILIAIGASILFGGAFRRR